MSDAGKPAKPVPGSTREPPPADPTNPDSHPAVTGLDSDVKPEPVQMPNSENVVNIPAPPKKK